MLSVQQELTLPLDSPWTTMPPLRLGEIPSGLGTADLFIMISADDRPVLRVDWYDDFPMESDPLDTLVWCDRVFVGFRHRV